MQPYNDWVNAAERAIHSLKIYPWKDHAQQPKFLNHPEGQLAGTGNIDPEFTTNLLLNSQFPANAQSCCQFDFNKKLLAPSKNLTSSMWRWKHKRKLSTTWQRSMASWPGNAQLQMFQFLCSGDRRHVHQWHSQTISKILSNACNVLGWCSSTSSARPHQHPAATHTTDTFFTFVKLRPHGSAWISNHLQGSDTKEWHHWS